MNRRTTRRILASKGTLLVAISGFLVTVTLLMIFPIHMGLSAGIASVSIVIFSAGLLISAIVIRYSEGRSRLVAYAALSASILGLLTPQVSLLRVANEQNVHLKFDLASYLRFSGDTTLKPAAYYIYKTVDGKPLSIAHYPPSSRSRSTGDAVVLLHGGGWRYGNYLQTGNWPDTLTKAGYSVFSVQYRLSAPDRPSWQQAPQDIKDAVAYLAANASRLNVSADSFHLIGQSAGGHLALLEAYRNQRVASVTSLYAPVDLELDYHTSRDKSAEINFIGGSPEQLPAAYKELSPLTYIAASSPRTLIIQGTRDDLVDKQNALLLDKRLGSEGVTHQLVLLPLTGHSFENQHGGFSTQIAEQSVISFLRR